jgi:hypothetical protein
VESSAIVVFIILGVVAFLLLFVIIGLIVFFRHRRYRTAKLCIVGRSLTMPMPSPTLVSLPPLPPTGCQLVVGGCGGGNACGLSTSTSTTTTTSRQQDDFLTASDRAAFMSDLTGGRALVPNATYMIRAKV